MIAMFKTIKSFIYKERNIYDQEVIRRLNQAGQEKPKRSKASVKNSELIKN